MPIGSSSLPPRSFPRTAPAGNRATTRVAPIGVRLRLDDSRELLPSPNRSRLLPTSVNLLSGRTLAIARFGWGGVGGGGRASLHSRAARHDPPPRPSPSRNRVYAGFGRLIKRSKSATADFDWGEGVHRALT